MGTPIRRTKKKIYKVESEESHGRGEQRGKGEVYLLRKLKDCFKEEPHIKAQIDLNRPGWSQGMKKQDNRGVEDSTNRAGRRGSKELIE